MRRVLFAILFMFLLAGCIDRVEVELSNWPNGYVSAVAVTFETERPNETQFIALADVLKSRGIKATFFVISGYFQDNPRSLDLLRDFEVANLGWYQTNWKDAALTKEFQEEEIRKADMWLAMQGFEVKGFKAPFLKSNKETFEVLQDLHYIYDSSEYYGFMPYWIDGVLEIPLSVNFDLYWDERSMKVSTMPAYLAFQKSLDESGLFTFYGHADRTYEHIDNFIALIDYMRKRDVWFASAYEVADWWGKRAKLELKKEGSAVIVKNSGASRVSGATVKIKGEIDVEDAVTVKKIGGYTYAVLPDMEPGASATIWLSER